MIVSQEDNAEARLGNLIAQQETLQQQLAFATQVESAKIIVPARAVKASAHSRRSSLLVGALIGLILGAIVAIIVDARSAPPSRPAPYDRLMLEGKSVAVVVPAHDEEGADRGDAAGDPRLRRPDLRRRRRLDRRDGRARARRSTIRASR